LTISQVVYVFGRSEQGNVVTLLTIYRAPNGILRAVAAGPRYSPDDTTQEEDECSLQTQNELLSANR